MPYRFTGTKIKSLALLVSAVRMSQFHTLLVTKCA